MKLEECAKNSKYGYRRRDWSGYSGCAIYNPSQGCWLFMYSTGVLEELCSVNQDANDWYLSDIPNAYYQKPKTFKELLCT